MKTSTPVDDPNVGSANGLLEDEAIATDLAISGLTPVVPKIEIDSIPCNIASRTACSHPLRTFLRQMIGSKVVEANI